LAAAPATLAPNAFIRVAPDNTVTVLIKHLEMGQGVYTGLATIVAEEMDADWAQVRAVHAPADVKLYANLGSGIQMTGGSTSIANSYQQLRQAGAMARAMLVQAAARRWTAHAAEIAVADGVLSYKTRRATFGELAAAAAQLPAPKDVALKDPKTFTKIGRDRLRLDTGEKVDGTALYSLDVRMPGLLTALVARPPRFKAAVKSVDAAQALAMPGVRHVVAIPSGVAVVADSFWQAYKARGAVRIAWDDAASEKRSTAQMLADYKAQAAAPGIPAATVGDVNAALGAAARTLTAEFEFPYLAHAPMEPLDCVIVTGKDGCEIWAGCQFHTVDQGNVAAVLGLKPEQVKINTLYAGGSFGRRASPTSDYLTEAAHIVKALPPGTPVKLVWTREDDIRGGLYRPMYYHRLTAGLDAAGKLTAWKHTIVGQSIMKGSPFEMMIKNGIDGTSVEGASNLPYGVANFLVELHTADAGVPVLWWRSVGSTHNAYATEVFADMVAKAMGLDPLAFRRSLLAQHPRHLRVLELAAEKAGWGTAPVPGQARGIAVAEAFGSYVAQVAEVGRGADGRIRVERVVCAVDCGTVVNPDVVRTQMEGGIAYGLGAVLKGAITLKDGMVEQSNFDTYTVLRMDEMPAVDVHIVASDAQPTGVGEPGVPPVGPAVANAIYALTGKPITRLPMLAAGVGV
jgi:isoquinoline 1-oxidoreductase beta subunit